MTVLVTVFITETVLSMEFATYARKPLGVIAINSGPRPTGIKLMTVLVDVFITETVLSMEFVTYAKGPKSMELIVQIGMIRVPNTPVRISFPSSTRKIRP
nr:hypothetical protein [Bacillus sp. SH7-1]